MKQATEEKIPAAQVSGVRLAKDPDESKEAEDDFVSDLAEWVGEELDGLHAAFLEFEESIIKADDDAKVPAAEVRTRFAALREISAYMRRTDRWRGAIAKRHAKAVKS